jgi:hypothetical protein
MNASACRRVCGPGFNPEQLSSDDDCVAVVAARLSLTDRILQISGESGVVRNLDQLDLERVTFTSVGNAVP